MLKNDGSNYFNVRSAASLHNKRFSMVRSINNVLNVRIRGRMRGGCGLEIFISTQHSAVG